MNILNTLYNSILNEGRYPKYDRFKIYNDMENGTLDWRKGNSVLAKEYQVPEGVMERMRRKYANETINKNRKPKNVPWAAVDWSKRSDDIAAELKVHPSSVKRMRPILAPQTINPLRRKKNIDWANADFSKPNKELKGMYNVGGRSVVQARKKNAPQTINQTWYKNHPYAPNLNKKRKKSKWEMVDWSKSDVDIGKEMQVDPYAVSLMRNQFSPRAKKL